MIYALLSKLARYVALSVFTISSLASCNAADDQNSVDNEEVEAPEVPLPSTMFIDLSVDTKSTQMLHGLKTMFASASLGVNHGLAAIVVAGVNSNIALHLSLPVAFLRGAQSATPRLQATNTFVWSYDFVLGGKEWTGNLTAVRDSADPEDIAWTLSASSDLNDANGCCDNFTYFTGRTTGKGIGSWQIFDPREPESEEKMFAISYDISEENEKQLLFEINSAKAPSEPFGQGSTIRYSAGEEMINLIVTDSKDGGPQTTIAWHIDTRAGWFKSVQGDVRCWDTADNDFVNIDCSGGEIESAEGLID